MKSWNEFSAYANEDDVNLHKDFLHAGMIQGGPPGLGLSISAPADPAVAARNRAMFLSNELREPGLQRQHAMLRTDFDLQRKNEDRQAARALLQMSRGEPFRPTFQGGMKKSKKQSTGMYH